MGANMIRPRFIYLVQDAVYFISEAMNRAKMNYYFLEYTATYITTQLSLTFLCTYVLYVHAINPSPFVGLTKIQALF